MADIKIYGTLVSATTDKAIVKNEQVVGGFMVLTAAERDSLTTALKKEGMTIFCTDDSKYYRLSQGAWIEVLNTEGVITEDKLKVDVLNNASIRTENDAMYLDLNKINLDTKVTGTIPVLLTLADSTKSGIMSKSDYSILHSLVTRVNTLEGQITRLLYTDGGNPTAEEINTFVEGEGYTSPFSGIEVVVAGTYHVWHYYENDNIGWRDNGVDTVNTFTNTAPGMIKGTAADGKVFAETDGTGSVYGWDNLLTRVSEAEDAIGAKQDEITAANKLNADYIENGTTNKVFTSAEKEKLSGIADNAQVNVIETIAVNGVDLAVTDKKVNIQLSILDALTDAQKAALNSGVTEDKITEYDAHVINKNNPHEVTKEQIGLGNVENTSDAEKPISTAAQAALDNKVDKVNGKGLSTNDYTTAEKTKLSGIETGANKTIVDSTLSTTSTNPVQNKVINTALSGKANTTHTHKIADVTNLQTTLDGKASTDPATQSANGLMSKEDKTKLDGISANATEIRLSDMEDNLRNMATDLGNKVDAVDGKGLSTNDYTTAEKNKLSGIAEGANKTIVDSEFSSTSTNPVQNKLINSSLNELNDNIRTLVGRVDNLEYAQLQIQQNVEVTTSMFSEDTTYADLGYNYKGTIPISGITTSDVVNVTFNMAQAVSGNFAPISNTYNGGVYIYAKEMPTSTITVALEIIKEATN